MNYYIFNKDNTWSVVTAKVHQLDKLKKPRERGKSRKLRDRPIISVMEFIPGNNLYKSNLNILFGKDALHDAGKKLLIEVGRILAFDVLINNWDRLPLIWDNVGNTENILFTDSNLVYGIDQSVQSINPKLHEENFKKYIAKVSTLLNHALALNTGDETGVNKVRNCIKQTTDYDIGVSGCKYLYIGLLKQIEIFCSTLDHTIIQSIYSNLEDEVTKMIGNMGYGMDTHSRYGLNIIDLVFLDTILALFKSHLPKITALLSKEAALLN